MKENFNGIDYNSCDRNLFNKNSSSIPRLIHQMWKSKNLLTYPINNSHSEWKRFYPNYEIRLWTDEDLEKLVLKTEYEYLYSIYKSYFYSIQRADLARLIILHAYGGIYADLDVFPCSEQIENLRLSNVSLIIPRSTSSSSLINHFLVSQKSSDILDYILHEIVPMKFYQRIYILPYLEVFSTGSFFLTRVLRKYIQLSKNKNHSLWILSESEVTNYVTHHTGRSWHLFDGFILNKIDQNPILFISFSTVLLLFLVCFIKYRTLIFKSHQLRIKVSI
jgi:mannosyltransferase OCH1-like enzyme